MPPGQAKRRQKQVGEQLIAPRTLRGIDEIVAGAAVRRDAIEVVALRDHARKRAVLRYPQFQQRAVGEIYLVLPTKEPGARALIDGGRRRIERAEASLRRVPVVHQKRREENVAGRE